MLFRATEVHEFHILYCTGQCFNPCFATWINPPKKQNTNDKKMIDSNVITNR